MPGETVRDALDRAREAYTTLTELGEEVDDEWSYVNALADAWRDRFDEVDADRGDEPVPDDAAAAIVDNVSEAFMPAMGTLGAFSVRSGGHPGD